MEENNCPASRSTLNEVESLEREGVVPRVGPSELGKLSVNVRALTIMLAVSHVFDEVTHGVEALAEDILVENPEHLAAVPVELEPFNHLGPMGAVLEAQHDAEGTAITIHNFLNVRIRHGETGEEFLFFGVTHEKRIPQMGKKW